MAEPEKFPRPAVRAAALATLAIAALGVVLIEGRIPVYYVGLTWAAGTPLEARRAAMARLDLYAADPARVSGNEAALYLLTDRSAGNVDAILRDPSIAAVTAINPVTRELTGRQEEDLRSLVSIRFPQLESLSGRIHSAVRWFNLVPLFVACLLAALALSRQGRRWLLERVPPLSPLALALFRVALAAALAFAVDRSLSEDRRPLCYLLLGAFAIGLLPRVALALFAFFVTRAYTGSLDDHDIALPLKTIWLLVLVPWGRGPGVEELVRRLAGGRFTTEPSRAYGLAIWIPTAMLGIAYAAAAWAKLDDGGLSWITSGAVRFIFIADAPRAPTEWGRMIAASDTWSVLLSAVTILLEAGMIAVAIWSRPSVRFACGLLALGLHVGFYLLQGLFWTWWWVLLVAFLPWQEIATVMQRALARGQLVAPPAPVKGLSALTATLIFLAVLQQPIVSLFRYEYLFMFSDFPMYANVYGVGVSKAEYAAFANQYYQPPPIVSFNPPIDRQLREVGAGEALVELVRNMARKTVTPEAAAQAIVPVAARYTERFGAAPSVDAFVDTWQFDWTTASFKPRAQSRLVATIDLGAGTLMPRAAGSGAQ